MSPLSQFIYVLAGLALHSVTPSCAAPTSAGHTISLQTSQTNTIRRGASELLRLHQKYGKTVPAFVREAACSRSSTVTVHSKQFDKAEYISVNLGGSVVNLQIDTGSTDLWSLSNLEPTTQTTGHRTYNTKNGKRQKGYTWSISYADGDGASGLVYRSDVTVGSITFTSEAVQAATSASSRLIADKSTDGIMGLGFTSGSTVKPKKQPSFFEGIASSLKKPIMAVNLKRGQSGSISFGSIDNTAYTGDLKYIPISKNGGYWNFKPDGYKVGNNSTISSPFAAIADTGASLMLVPTDVTEGYYSHVKGAYQSQTYGGWVFPCSSTLPDLVFTFGKIQTKVPGNYILYAPEDDETCFGSLQDAGEGDNILGIAWLKALYAVFDLNGPRLGVAQKPT